jgi:type IV secretory pathway VirB2 component (pilin)
MFSHSLVVLMAAADAVCGNGNVCETGLPNVDASHAQLQQILQIVFGILAALAVLMIVIAGLRFITAQGNPQENAKARNTIVYAVVGLLVALIAEIFVSFILGKL